MAKDKSRGYRAAQRIEDRIIANIDRKMGDAAFRYREPISRLASKPRMARVIRFKGGRDETQTEKAKESKLSRTRSRTAHW